ncbi:hypothetical protein V2J09_007327 [Rumex salicifolius]
MKITIATFIHEFALDVGSHESVLQIKQKIEAVVGFPTDLQTLSVMDYELTDNLNLEDCPFITEGTRIDLILNGLDQLLSYEQQDTSSKIEITIKFTSRQVTIEVDKTETVRSLKEKIHIIDATPIKRMTLFISGTEMEDELRTLAEYGVHDKSEVAVLLKSMSRLKESSAMATRKLRVVVQTSTSLMNGASIPLEIKDSTTIAELKQMILSRGILPLDDYIFIHKQRIMRVQCTLRWHGVENGDYLSVFKGTVSRSNEF